MSAGAAWGMVTNILSVGLFCGICGYLIYTINQLSLMFSLSYSTLNTMNYITMIFALFPFVYAFICVLNYVLTSASEAGGYA